MSLDLIRALCFLSQAPVLPFFFVPVFFRTQGWDHPVSLNQVHWTPWVLFPPWFPALVPIICHDWAHRPCGKPSSLDPQCLASICPGSCCWRTFFLHQSLYNLRLSLEVLRQLCFSLFMYRPSLHSLYRFPGQLLKESALMGMLPHSQVRMPHPSQPFALKWRQKPWRSISSAICALCLGVREAGRVHEVHLAVVWAWGTKDLWNRIFNPRYLYCSPAIVFLCHCGGQTG